MDYFGSESDFDIDYTHEFEDDASDSGSTCVDSGGRSPRGTDETWSDSEATTKSSSDSVANFPCNLGQDADVYFDTDGAEQNFEFIFSQDERARADEEPCGHPETTPAPGGSDAINKKQRAEELRKILEWVKGDVSSHHKSRIGFATPPDVPFVVGFDPRTCLLYITFSNILCVDIDEKDGLEKEEAAQIIEKEALREGLTFRLYETDRGIHAYCTSNTFYFRDQATLSLMDKMMCDKYYIGFVGCRGFSMRVSPKAFAAEDVTLREPKSKREFEAQFVKRVYLSRPMVGKGVEDQALVSMVGLAADLANFTRGILDLHERVNSNLEHENLLRSVTHKAEMLYNSLLNGPNRKSMLKWLKESHTFSVPYVNDVQAWKPCKNKPMHECTIHPVDGRPIVVYQCLSGKEEGQWAYVHNKVYSKTTFPSKAEAKRAVVRAFSALRPGNVQERVPPVKVGVVGGASIPSSSAAGPTPSSSRNATPHTSMPSASVTTWSVAEVSTWVANCFSEKSFGERYGAKIIELGVDGDMLMNDLTDVSLESDFQMPCLHRSRLLRKRDELRA